MEAIRHLLSFFLRIAIAFFLLAFVWGIAGLFFPSLSFKAIMPAVLGKGSTSTDILPSPRQYAGLFSKKNEPGVNTNVFTPGPAFNGYDLSNSQYSYSTYSYSNASGNVSTTNNTITSTTNTASQQGGVQNTIPTNTQAVAQKPATPKNPSLDRNLYIRNLSIYEGGHVYTNLFFVGEARSTMFREGRFPIVLVDQFGKVIGVSAAVAQSNWAVPGWVRFETKIPYSLPNKAPCTMVFEEALTQAERATRQPARVPIRVQCN